MEGSSSLYVTTLLRLVTIVSDSEDIKYIIFDKTSCDHLLKGLCDFMSENVNHHLAKFGGHRPCGRRVITDLTFHDNVIKTT